MTAEATVLTALETSIQTLAAFGETDVVINDYAIFDEWAGNSPYVILSISDEFASRMDTSADQNQWKIGLLLALEWTGWKATLDSFGTHRQNIINLFNSGSVRSAGGIEAFDISELRSNGPILPRFPPYVENLQEATPLFLFQEMIVVAEEW